MRNTLASWLIICCCAFAPRIAARAFYSTGILAAKLDSPLSGIREAKTTECHTLLPLKIVQQDKQDKKKKHGSGLHAKHASLAVRGGGVASVASTIFNLALRNPILVLLMVASTLVSVYKESIRYAKLAEAAIQGCICVYVFLALLSWQSEKEKD